MCECVSLDLLSVCFENVALFCCHFMLCFYQTFCELLDFFECDLLELGSKFLTNPIMPKCVTPKNVLYKKWLEGEKDFAIEDGKIFCKLC